MPDPAARSGPSIKLLLLFVVPALVVLGLLPRFIDPYQTVLLTYGLIMAIAALGFNLLLGYTGLLSFGHSAYFGAGAYTVAFIVRDLGAQSMELCILGGLLGTLVVSALFGFVCVRHTRIFFGILTLALQPGAVEPRLQVLLGDRRHRRHSRGLRQAHPARRPDRLQGIGLVPALRVRLLLLRARDLRGGDCHHVGDRALPVRQGAAGDPRQRGARGVRRRARAALPLDRLRHLRRCSRGLPASCGCPSTGSPHPTSSIGRSRARSCS